MTFTVSDIDKKARELKTALEGTTTRRVSLKDVKTYLTCKIRAMADQPTPYFAAWGTRLYIKQGDLYCQLICIENEDQERELYSGDRSSFWNRVNQWAETKPKSWEVA